MPAVEKSGWIVAGFVQTTFSCPPVAPVDAAAVGAVRMVEPPLAAGAAVPAAAGALAAADVGETAEDAAAAVVGAAAAVAGAAADAADEAAGDAAAAGFVAATVAAVVAVGELLPPQAARMALPAAAAIPARNPRRVRLLSCVMSFSLIPHPRPLSIADRLRNV